MGQKTSREDLEKLTVDELRSLARKNGVAKFSRLGKAELINQLAGRELDDGKERSPATRGQSGFQVSLWERIIAYTAALVALGLVVFVVIRNQPFASPNIVVLLRIVISLSVAVLGATVPGFLHVSWAPGGAAIRAGGALALFLLTYLFTPEVIGLESTGAVNYQFEETERGEPVRRELTLFYKRGAKSEEIKCVGDCTIEGRPEEIQPVGVDCLGYDYAEEQTKLKEGIILLQRQNPIKFQAAIKPKLSPDEDQSVRKPSRDEYLAAIKLDKPLDVGKFVCDNQTPYRVDLLVFPWKPKDVSRDKSFPRYMSLPPCLPKKPHDYVIQEDDPGVYYFVYASVFGQTAQYLAQGSLHDPEIPTIEVGLSSHAKGILTAKVTRAQPTVVAQGDIQ